MNSRSRYLCLMLVVGFLLSGANPANWPRVDKYRFFLGESIQSELVRMIDRADDSVTVGMYYVMPPETAAVNGVLQALVRASNRGVDVKFGIEKKQGKLGWNKKPINYLRRHGIDVRPWTDDQIQHQKAVVVDEKSVFIGSQNFSYSGLTGNNWETGALFSRKDMAVELKQYLLRQR